MTDNEINILREERVRQLLTSLGQRAGLANAICKEFGEKGLEVIKKEIEKDITSWIYTIVDQYKKNGIKRDINGIHSFLWEENKLRSLQTTQQKMSNNVIETTSRTRNLKVWQVSRVLCQ